MTGAQKSADSLNVVKGKGAPSKGSNTAHLEAKKQKHRHPFTQRERRRDMENLPEPKATAPRDTRASRSTEPKNLESSRDTTDPWDMESKGSTSPREGTAP